MFSHNGRISMRQLRRMLVLSVFAGGIFVIPFLAAKLFGTSVFWGLCIFFVLACIYVACIYKLANRFHFVECAAGIGCAGKLILVIQALRQMFRFVFYVILSVAILREAQVPFMQGKENSLNLLVMLPLLLVAVYGAAGVKKEGEQQPFRIEKQGRLYEMIFWILFIPFIVMVLLGLNNVDWHIFVPKCEMPVLMLFLYAYFMLAFLLPVENYFYLKPCLADQKGHNLYYAVMGTVAVIILLTFALLGIYGVHGAADEEMLTIVIMRYVSLPFGILERLDSLVVWFFMTGCFVLISQTLYFTGYLLSALFPKAKRLWIIVAVALAGLVVPIFIPDYETVLPLYMQYGALIDLPLSLIMPLLLWGLVSWKKEKTECQKKE